MHSAVLKHCRNLLPYIILVMLLLPSRVYGQSLQIRGTIRDTTGNSLPNASVILLSAKDSLYLKSTLASTNGDFRLSIEKPGRYILKVSHVGFKNRNIKIDTDRKRSDNEVALDTIVLEQIDIKLMEVVVKKARAPLTFKGDTIEYDISQFHFAPGTNVEEALRQLPGIDIDSKGVISSDGEQIQNILVNGKRFFDGSHQKATRGLYADMLSVVQVYNSETEHERLTGIKSAEKAKTMNFQLKELYSKLTLGQIDIGARYPKLYESKIQLNRFTEKHQFAIIGLANTINKTGLSSSEASNLYGDNLSAISNFGPRTTTLLDDYSKFRTLDEVLTSDPKGHQRTSQGSINYNLHGENTKITTNYFLGSVENRLFNRNSLKSYTESQKYYEENSANFKTERDFAHNFSFYLEQNVGKKNKIALNLNGMILNDRDSENDEKVFIDSDKIVISRRQLYLTKPVSNRTFSGVLFFNRRFKKSGRLFSASFSYLISDDKNPIAAVSSLDSLLIGESAENVRDQMIVNNSLQSKFVAGAIISEKLSKYFSINFFYNSVGERRRSTNTTSDGVEGDRYLIDSLSWSARNGVNYWRLGTELTFSRKGLNITTGIAKQDFLLNGTQQGFQNFSNLTAVRRYFGSNSPYLNFSIVTGIYRIASSYYSSLDSPDFEKMMPTIINYDQTEVFLGNPNLSSVVQDIFKLSISRSDRKRRETITLNSTITLKPQDISFRQDLDEDFNSRYVWENVFNARTIVSFISYYKSFANSKTSIQSIIQSNNRIGKNYLGERLIVNNSWRNSIQGTVRYFPSKNIMASNTLKLSESSYRNVVQTSVSRSWHYDANFDINYRLSSKLSLNSQFRYMINRYRTSGYSNSIPTWNLGFQWRVLNNKGIFNLLVSDVLNRRKQVSIYSNSNYVSISETSMLGRYGLVSFTYLLKNK